MGLYVRVNYRVRKSSDYVMRNYFAPARPFLSWPGHLFDDVRQE